MIEIIEQYLDSFNNGLNTVFQPNNKMLKIKHAVYFSSMLG